MGENTNDFRKAMGLEDVEELESFLYKQCMADL
jgi:hypothetical protein